MFLSRDARQLFVDGLLNRPHRPGYVILRDVIEVYDNDDAIGCELAEDAVNADRPAYWTSARYHAARCIELCNDVNRGAELETALLGLYPDHLAYGREAALDTLIPLNRLAANELSEAYEIVGTFRDCGELEARRYARAS